MSATNNKNFVSFSIFLCLLFLSLFWLHCISRTRLNNRDDTGYLCPVPYFKENSFSVCATLVILVRGVLLFCLFLNQKWLLNFFF